MRYLRSDIVLCLGVSDLDLLRVIEIGGRWDMLLADVVPYPHGETESEKLRLRFPLPPRYI